jgi:hypothetical protein
MRPSGHLLVLAEYCFPDFQIMPPPPKNNNPWSLNSCDQSLLSIAIAVQEWATSDNIKMTLLLNLLLLRYAYHCGRAPLRPTDSVFSQNWRKPRTGIVLLFFTNDPKGFLGA